MRTLNVVLLVLALLVFVFAIYAGGTPRWGLACGILLALLSLFNLIVFLSGLDDLIFEIARLYRGRYSKALGLAALLTLWIWGVGVFGGSAGTAIHQNVVWSFPWDQIAKPEILVGTLLGIATLFALIITFAEVKEHLRPRAMNFKEAIRRASAFIVEYRQRECILMMCSYYPAIGAVNREQYDEEYDSFCQLLKTNKVRCLCLAMSDRPPATAEELRVVSKEVQGRRPTTIQEAVAAFASMWYLSNDETGAKALDKFSTAMLDIRSEVEYLRSPAQKLLQFTRFVPDFHFLLALKDGQAALAGFLLTPLRPAGMPPPNQRGDKTPPMMGMEVHDPEILSHLYELYNALSGTLQDEQSQEATVTGKTLANTGPKRTEDAAGLTEAETIRKAEESAQHSAKKGEGVTEEVNREEVQRREQEQTQADEERPNRDSKSV